jgi:hypothetical protein
LHDGQAMLREQVRVANPLTPFVLNLREEASDFLAQIQEAFFGRSDELR